MNKNILLASAALSVVPTLVAAKAPGKRVQPKQPNIIFILCDDMGYGDLACYGQPYISTPNIDRMAEEGMRFTQAYAGSPVSAPSRASIMTGQHSGHGHVRGNREYWSAEHTVMYGNNVDFAVVGQEPYDPQHKILPEMLKDHGYTTGVFGKWAGGYEGSPSTPDKRGVDEFYGYICQFQAHLYYPNFLNRYSRSMGDTAVVREVMEQNIQYPMFGRDYHKRQQYSARIIHDKALEWIDRQDGKKPFVGFLTYTLPHAELAQPYDSIVEGYEKKFFVDKNTLVIFTSDNGPHEEGGADPEFFGRDGKLRGLKRQCYEGGIRIPFIAWWPGHVKAGEVNDLQFAFYDLMPTFCDLAGVKNFRKRYTNRQLAGDGFDGLSIAPTLLGDDAKQLKHDHLYWEFHETDQIAVRRGDWKLIVVKGKPHLYNLVTDLHEDNDVSAAHPDIVAELVDVIRKEHVDNPLFKVTLPY